jgi:hypothetical protein
MPRCKRGGGWFGKSNTDKYAMGHIPKGEVRNINGVRTLIRPQPTPVAVEPKKDEGTVSIQLTSHYRVTADF